MPKLRVLSGLEVVKIFTKHSFAIAAQKGSHVKLQRITVQGVKQTLTVPNHKELDRGTLEAVYKQAVRYIPEQELRKYFYTQ